MHHNQSITQSLDHSITRFGHGYGHGHYAASIFASSLGLVMGWNEIEWRSNGKGTWNGKELHRMEQIYYFSSHSPAAFSNHRMTVQVHTYRYHNKCIIDMILKQ